MTAQIIRFPGTCTKIPTPRAHTVRQSGAPVSNLHREMEKIAESIAQSAIARQQELAAKMGLRGEMGMMLDRLEQISRGKGFSPAQTARIRKILFAGGTHR